jgi:hypothetical protein
VPAVVVRSRGFSCCHGPASGSAHFHHRGICELIVNEIEADRFLLNDQEPSLPPVREYP